MNWAVIATNSNTVVRNIPDYAIVGGNPVIIIKYRFKEDQIKSLLEIKWWNWDQVKINDNILSLCSENIDEFISTHKT